MLCDEGFRDIFTALERAPHAQASLNVWLPPGSGLREQMVAMLATYPDGFKPSLGADGESVLEVDCDMAEWELKRHKTLMRARAKLKAVYRLNKIALSSRKRPAAETDAAAEEGPGQ